MKKIYALIAAVLLFGSVSAFAATTQDVNMDVEIPDLLALGWNVNGSVVDLTGANKITFLEFNAGYKDAIDGGTLDVSSNAAWNLSVVASADNFTGGTGVKPTSDLLIDIENQNLYAFPINGITPVAIYTNQPFVQNGVVSLQYKILLNPTDTAGVYSTTLTYTLSKF